MKIVTKIVTKIMGKLSSTGSTAVREAYHVGEIKSTHFFFKKLVL